jgi:ADP-heptose:LPS heptosyltransferase
VIHFAVKRTFMPVIEANPYIDSIHPFEGDLKLYTEKLREEKFDFIVDLHSNLRSGYIRGSLRVPSAGFPKLNVRKLMLTRLKIDLMPQVHIVDRYFKAVSGLGVKNDGKGLDYFIPAAGEVDTSILPEAFRKGFIAFAIGARHATKRLPEHKIVSICKMLAAPVVLLGGPGDAAKAKNIAEASGPLIYNACGRLNLNQSASLVRQADAVITHDTGMMHIAAAFGKRIISIWGNTVPQIGMYPYMPGNEEKSFIIGVDGLKCRPCSKLGFDKCPKRHFRCMEDINEEEVVKAVKIISH